MSPNGWIGVDPWFIVKFKKYEEIKEIINIITKKEEFSKLYLITGRFIDLFREAASCYFYNAYMAAIALSATALESLVYNIDAVLKGKSRKCYEGILIEADRDESVLFEKYRFDQVIKDLESFGIVNEKLHRKINKNREYRNIVVHHGQKVEKIIREAIRIVLSGKKSIQDLRTLKGSGWASQEDARRILRETAEIMAELLERAYPKICNN